MMSIKEQAENLSDQIIKWRRDLHQIPESGLHCPQTAAYICNCLDQMGISWKSYKNHSGITALIGSGRSPVIALRADIDALDVKEENKLDYASKNGKMHACGHDAHAAALLGAAKILKGMEDKLSGTVKLIFQPDEEGLSGAKAMLEDGVLEDPHVDRIYALHVGSIVQHGTRSGQLFWKTGAVFASSDCIKITIHGKGGHASTPFLAINPILIAAEVINSLQGLVSRESTYNVPAVLTVTGITAGNGAYNIIPDSAAIIGGLRTQGLDVRSHLLKRMEEIAKDCAAMYGAAAEMEVPSGCPPVINDPAVTADFIAAAKKVFPAGDILELDHSSMGGEDSSYFFTEVPGCYAFLYNSIPSDDGKEYPHHNSRFSIDDSVLYLASAVFAQAVADQISK